MNNFQSEEPKSRRGTVDGLMHYMEQHVGSLGTHFQEESVRLRHCETESEEHSAKERGGTAR
eukprot:1397730-Prorocentrum_lima.AAC.1